MSSYVVTIDRKNLYSKDYTQKKCTSKDVNKNVKITESFVNVLIKMIKNNK